MATTVPFKIPLTPTHPGLAAIYRSLKGRAARDVLFWQDGKGTEALVLGKKIVAARRRGKLREGPAHEERKLGDVVRALLRAPSRSSARAFEVVYVAYNRAGRASSWDRERAGAGHAAMKVGGLVRRYHVTPFDDRRGPEGIWGTEREQLPPMPAPKKDHPRGGTTDVQSILLPKVRFPRKSDAAAWLRRQKKPFRADRIEDSGKVRPGRYWRARQFDPRRGFRKATKNFGAGGIKAVVEARGHKRPPTRRQR